MKISTHFYFPYPDYIWQPTIKYNKAGNIPVTLTLRRVHATIVAMKNQYKVFWECVFLALGVQHAMRMRRIILSSVACPALKYFSTLSHE
jgi:hypothetical protein